LTEDQSNSLLTTQPPGFTPEEACSIALEHFAIKISASPLWSERDQNFGLQTGSGQRFVLKIANALEDPQVIDFQTRALEHIARVDPQLPVPRTIVTVSGKESCLVADQDGRQHVVRLISWLEGRIIEEHETGPALLHEMGQALARLGIALRNFSHPAANHKLLWDLKNAAELLELLPHIDQPALRTQLEKALDTFVQRVHPALDSLRAQIIHADLNRGNILISEGEPGHVTGIIDFGDMVHTPLIMDLAIAAAYHLSASGDPLESAMHFILGYHQVTPLTPLEADILLDLMIARLCTSITVQMWRAKLYPENSEYLLIHNRAARDTLDYLSRCPADRLRMQIRQACA